MKIAVFAFSCFLIGYVNVMVYLQNKTLVSNDTLLGPLGALALSLVGLYFAVKVIMSLSKKNEQLQQERIEEYKKRITELENNDESSK